MAIVKKQKKEIIDSLKDKFAKSKSVVFLSFQGLTVAESADLRKKLRKENIEYKVSKKTFIRIGLENAKFENADKLNLEGPVAVAVGYEDEVSPARISKEYSRTNNKLKILGGYVSAKYMNAAEMNAIALLPGKDQLRAQLIGTINAPISGFVNVLAGNIRGLANVLKAIGDKKK